MRENVDYLKIWELPKTYEVQPYKSYPVYIYHSSYAPFDTKYYENILVRYTFNNILKRENTGGESGDIEDILQDRKNLIRSKIELILLQLGQRKTINHDVIKSINYDMCKTQTFLMGMDHENQALDRNRLSIEQLQFDLDRQLRMEQLNYFKDTGMLNRDLRDALIQYVDQVQKDSIINRLEVET